MNKEFINKVAKIQNELKAPKSQYNSFGKYHYRNVEDIQEAVKPLNLANGLLLFISDEIVQIGERYYVKATATLTDGENTLSVSALARESFDKKGMDDAQITGACSSYARKYALNGLYAIDDTKDADSHDNTQKTNKTLTEKVNEVTKDILKPTDLITVQALVDATTKDPAKAVGFKWNGDKKQWTKQMTQEELSKANFPFQTKIIGG